MYQRWLAIDIGGTKILMGLLDEQAHIYQQRREPVVASRDAEACLEQIARMSQTLLKQAGLTMRDLSGIGVACPGPLDWEQGVVLGTPNLNWSGLSLRDQLDELFERPVYLDNDANMAACGAYAYDNPHDFQHMLYLTVSTGIGGALILNGELYRGSIGGAGEIGHMIMQPGGPRCGCGGYGCLEALASGSALSRGLAERLAAGKAKDIAALGYGSTPPGPPEIAAAARQGDAEALELLEPVKKYLGAGMAGLVNIFNPQCIVIGGGVGLGMADLLLPSIQKTVNEHVFALHRKNLQIRTTALGDDIVLKGIVAAILNHKD